MNLLPFLCDGKDGLSWLPTLYGKPSPEHDYIFVDNSTVITRDGWKLVPDKKKLLLFNLNDDPGEREDLAKRHPEKFARLNSILELERNSQRQDLAKSEWKPLLIALTQRAVFQ